MKRSLLLIAVLLIIFLSMAYYLATRPDPKKSVAIVTTLSHPALDSAQQSFIDRFTATNPDIALIIFNAEGNVQQANLIAKKVVADKNIQGIFAIGTLAAQTVTKTTTQLPIVVAAVSDPQVLPANDNSCGLTDTINADYQIDTIIKALPEIKTISLLYSSSEANSVSMVNSLTDVIKKKSLSHILVGVHEAQHIMPASLRACMASDAILIPLDNQLVASFAAVIKATKNLPCAVITSNESPIHDGATIAFGVDYEKSGRDAAHLMAQILAGKSTPQSIGFINPSHLRVFANQRVLKAKGLRIADEAPADIVKIDEL